MAQPLAVRKLQYTGYGVGPACLLLGGEGAEGGKSGQHG